jgi:CDP-diacylglycerol--glycerol-3-phosphate 3-phosphatidyltransferase
MTSADKVTSIRLILAPVFFIIFFVPEWLGIGAAWTVPVLWLVFIISEITDLIDGKIARSQNLVSDFGKLYDPFADTLTRITYFLCFVADGILPVFLFAVVLYREFGILFIRMLMMRMGVAMGARSGGKAKAVAYMVTGVIALFAASFQRLSFDPRYFTISRWVSVGLFAVSVVLSLASFGDYYRVFKSSAKELGK